MAKNKNKKIYLKEANNSQNTKKNFKKVKLLKSKERITPINTRVEAPEYKLHKTNKVKTFLDKNIRTLKAIVYFGTLLGIFLWLFWGVPLPTKLGSVEVPVSTKLFDRQGKLIYEIYTEKRSTPVTLNELPSYVKDATISIEDKDFYKHYGVSLPGILRALYNTTFKGKLQGGSTLTQQLIKNSLLTQERTVKRKVREFILTMAVESIYTKDKILELYLNQIPYGGTAYGIGAASEIYFGKEAKDLTLAEATLLAGLPASPSRYSPFGAHPELAKERQVTVLRRMTEDKHISEEDAKKTEKEVLNYSEPSELKAPHFALYVKELLADKYGDAVVEKGGLRVTTTLDLDLQEFAQDAVATEVAKLKKQKVGNGAALVTHPATGEILAMVGSKDYFAKDEDGKVNIIFSKRQPGSSIKPLNYALAIKDLKITPSTPFADVPTCFSSFGQPPYCPRNYDGGFHGIVQTRFALGNSYNIPAVRILAINGVDHFIDFAKDMGISTLTNATGYGLSLTLGGGEVKPYDMASAFGIFANQGVKQNLISILKVEDWKGNILEETKPKDIKLTGDRILEPDVTFLISHMLEDNNARIAAFGGSSFLNVKGHGEVSVKTGTTNDRKDNWTIGYSAHALTLTWVGNNDNTTMAGAVSGVSGASPIWNIIMKQVLDKADKGFYDNEDVGPAWPKQPQGVVGANVCVTTGNLPSNPDAPECPTRFEYFLKGKVGAGVDTGQKDLQLDKTTHAVAAPDLPPDQIETQNHPYLTDPLGTLVCLDCAIASSSATTISYPLRK